MLKQPSTNVKMTNVATIRYKINNKNFQIACYRNKALNWRNGVEEDLSEVLQIQEIYQNASHGTQAKKADLNKFFPSKSKKEIIQMILQRGELQISDKQRDIQQANITADIIKIIVQKCVHPVTKRRFISDNIRQAVKDIHFAVKTDQPAKKQALQCIKLLQKRYKIVRGDMRIRITFESKNFQIIEKQLALIDIKKFQSQEQKANSIISRVYDIQPNKYRQINQLCKKQDNTTVEVLQNVVVNTQYKDLDSEQSGALELLDQFKNKGEDQEQSQQKRQNHQNTNMKRQFQKMNMNQKKQQKQIKCSSCGQTAIFSTAYQQRQHFKSQWHVQNVKRKSKGLGPLSEQDYRIEIFNKEYK